MKVILLTTILLLCFSNEAKAKYIFNETTQYYAINEPEPEALLSTVSRTLKPACKSKRRVFTCISSTTDITYEPLKIGMGICRLSPVNVTESVTYRIPKWNQAYNVPLDVVKQWKSLIKESIAHAKHHGAIRNKYMKIANKKLLRLEARCSRIKKEAKKIIAKSHDKIKRDNKRLDSRQSHYPSSFPSEEQVDK